MACTVRNPLPIPNANTEALRLAARRRLQIPNGAQLVGNEGWLIRRKRFDVFLDVAAIIANRVPSAVFMIAGDGPERAALEAQAQRLGIGDRVVWAGWKTDLEDFYRALDVLLFNADYDAFPTTPLEAMSYGIPVVASVLHGGLREVITDGDVGFLIDRHDIETLAIHVMDLTTHSRASSTSTSPRTEADIAARSSVATTRIRSICSIDTSTRRARWSFTSSAARSETRCSGAR